jgi:uncharacterized protein YbaR (Trm112 family)
MQKILVRCPSCNVFLNIVKKESDQSLTCPRCQFRGIVSQFPIVIPKKISCPACKTVISINPEHKGMLACPHCKQERDLADYPDAALRQSGGAATELPSLELGGTLSRPGVLVREEGDVPAAPAGQTIILKKGVNTLGRGEQCSLRIAHIDEYMSRLHASIELCEKNGMFEHILSDAGSVNGTYHNEERLGKGDAVILKPGDRIRIGHTTYKFILT